MKISIMPEKGFEIKIKRAWEKRKQRVKQCKYQEANKKYPMTNILSLIPDVNP